MARHTHRKSRNFGYGKHIIYAGKNALRTACNGGRFGTVSTHNAHWRKFCQWMKNTLSIHDARQIQTLTLDLYAQYIVTCSYSPAYAQNLVSSVNVVLEHIRGDSRIWVSPLRALGAHYRRSTIRVIIPNRDMAAIEDVCMELHDQGHDMAAAVVRLCRTLGLRCREAAMLDVKGALVEVTKNGYINVVAGTKNGRGRYVDRLVPVSQEALSALDYAANVQSSRRNLIPYNKTCHQFLNHVRSVSTQRLRLADIKSLHHLRAAYACDRYQQITDSPPPLISGGITCGRDQDYQARETISQELGHSRVDVLRAYVGGRK